MGYLAGGTPFAPTPFTSRNITLDASGLPAGLPFEAFELLIRTGEDPDHFAPLLQLTPRPTFRKMNDHDLRPIYEYLSAIPSNPRKDRVPGPCHSWPTPTGAGLMPWRFEGLTDSPGACPACSGPSNPSRP